MKWKEFVEMTTNTVYQNAKRTDIECPKCGEKIYCRTDIVLATYPPKRSYFCECGWTGTA